MTEDEIRQATREQLQVMVAERLDYHYYWYNFLGECYLRDPGEQSTIGMTTLTSVPDGVEINLVFVPDWPNDIALAWELDRDDWQWDFEEGHQNLAVSVWGSPADTVFEPWLESKAQTYATARCRAWLLAKLVEDAPSS